MQSKKKWVAFSIFAALIISLIFSGNVLAEQITVTGEVNDNYQIVSSDGQVYEVADTEKGNEVVVNLISQVVKVTGTVTEADGVKTISITSYEVIGE
ncbi:MAG: hypothetical protein JW786_12300 [Desulfobacterales bacterium]|nr:hypothetical protein [Desulfobacterales bacterium]